ncbi:MAG: lipocalin-like domain-containing protein [Steroidobacteraceae bacterium]|nr:lipocalin-like domain-containing protein [Steroidobacteraceae bacterium]
MNAKDLIGTWSLESAQARSSGGAVMLPLGDSPRGFLTYTADGYMAAVLMRNGRPKFGSGDFGNGTPDEIKQAFEGFDAYAGPYDFDKKSGTVTHHAEVARFPNWEGSAQVRYARILDDILYLTTPPVLIRGGNWIAILTWKRVAAR